VVDVECFESGTWEEIDNLPTCAVVAADPADLVVVAPSVARVGESVRAAVRCIDAFGNPVSHCDAPVAMSMDQANRRLYVGCRGKGPTAPGVMIVMNADNGKIVASAPIAIGVVDNDNVGSLSGTVNVVGEAPAAPAQGEEQKAAEKAAAAPAKDENYWRGKFADAQKKLDSDAHELDILQREYNLKQQQFYTDPMASLKQEYSRQDLNDQKAKIDAMARTSKPSPISKINCVKRAGIRAGRRRRRSPRADPRRSQSSIVGRHCDPAQASGNHPIANSAHGRAASPLRGLKA
jgi:hypothetical protein